MTDLIPVAVTLDKARRDLAAQQAAHRGIVDQANSAVYGVEDMARKAGVTMSAHDQMKARHLAQTFLGIDQVTPRVTECEEALLVAMFDAGMISVTELHLARNLPPARAAVLAAGMTPPA